MIEKRQGLLINQSEIDYLNSILVPLIKIQGQSIHQAILNNKNKIMFSDKTIYKLIDLGQGEKELLFIKWIKLV